jgi:magnesium chelatase subunit ChlD-like protein
MRRHGALTEAKGVLLGYLEQAYHRRARIAVLGTTAGRPHWLVEGQRASLHIPAWLENLGAGGGTPLIESLHVAHDWLKARERSHGGEASRVMVLTDGRIRNWSALPSFNVPVMVLDAERAPVRLGRARQLADGLQAAYRHIDDLADDNGYAK